MFRFKSCSLGCKDAERESGTIAASELRHLDMHLSCFDPVDAREWGNTHRDLFAFSGGLKKDRLLVLCMCMAYSGNTREKWMSESQRAGQVI